MTASELNKLKTWFLNLSQPNQMAFLKNFHRKIHQTDINLSTHSDLTLLFDLCCQQIQITTEQVLLIKDLRGVPCPLNSAKARVYLHKLTPNTACEIWLDSGKPIENVPSAIIADGHKILNRTWQKNDNYWILKIHTKD